MSMTNFIDLLGFPSLPFRHSLDINSCSALTSFDGIEKYFKRFRTKSEFIYNDEFGPVSGVYDQESNRIYITINKFYRFEEVLQEAIKTLTHELIHMRQFMWRDFQFGRTAPHKHPYHRYLASSDETEAYSHDSYLDVHYFNNSKSVLETVNYQTYSQAFGQSIELKKFVKSYYRWVYRYQNS